MKAITSKYTVLLVLFLSLTEILFGQYERRTNLFTVDSICQTASKLPLNEGIALIRKGFEKCGRSDRASDCLFKLNFTAGYLYQIASAESTDIQQAQLEKALQYYKRAHELARKDISVINNMFLVSKALGNLPEAINILDMAIAVDKKNRTKYIINKGDICFDNKDFKTAIEFYKPAFWADMNNEAVGWKTIYSYAQLPNKAEAFEGLLSFSNALFDQGLNDLARNGFLNLLKNAISENDNAKAEQGCVRWAETIARKEAITGTYIDELPDLKTWTSACNKELQMLLTNSFGNSENLRWWAANNYRRHIVASILLRMESAALLSGNVKSGVQMLENALKIAPEFYVYNDDPNLKTYFPAKMDVAIELSRLYNRYPELDLNKAKYDNLINELFNEKSMHYLQNDLASIQKSHTMLGLIFADRNIWQSSWFAGNAIFQLENAIKFQKRIEKENPEKFKPVPALYQTLAKGYKITHKPEMEYKTLIDAAAGYLELDNLSMADSIIQKVRNSPFQDVGNRQKIKELELITSMRFNIRNGNYGFRDENINALEKTITESELFMLKNSKNDSSFMNRQKFKILSDIGSKCSELNPAYNYPVFEINALAYIDKEKALGNYQDINRLNHIEGKFINSLDKESVITINQYALTNEVRNQSKSWSLNSGGYQTRIEADPDLIVAGKVYANIVKRSSDKDVSGLDQVQIRQGEVSIPKELWEKASIDETNIKRVKGVKTVHMVDSYQAK